MNKKPNVIFVLTDDQGYADLGCHGNKNIKTPNLDEFYKDCTRFTDFHVAPLCAPTRGALMTGRRPLRNGVWATCWGRSILKEGEYTLADCFADNGYETGMFGKWHLGDNYPSRPEDKGFKKVVAHKGGGVGQSPDFWGNNYFDDTYFENGEAKEYEGYCTDVWFDQAKRFISDNKEKPFFAYIATNAPHSPYLVDKKYSEQYYGNDNIVEPEFYGMITNIDENFGKLREFLKENDLEDNTILMFMTDNGSSGSCTLDSNAYCSKGYNANMRGKKGSYYDGGHRVPFFIRWKDGELVGGKDINSLAMGVDFFPTLMELCSLENKRENELDGQSLVGAIAGEEITGKLDFLQYRQDTIIPEKWQNVVLFDKWRLVYGKELYNIENDPEQRNDVALQYPEMVEKLRAEHEKWWDEIYEEVQKYATIVLGNEAENPAVLNPMDVLGDVAWHQIMVSKNFVTAGKWHVRFDEKGTYKFSLMRYPEELKREINKMVEESEIEELAPYGYAKNTVVVPVDVKYSKVKMELFGEVYEKPVSDGDVQIDITVEIDNLEETDLCAKFIYDEDKSCGVYYITVEKL